MEIVLSISSFSSSNLFYKNSSNASTILLLDFSPNYFRKCLKTPAKTPRGLAVQPAL